MNILWITNITLPPICEAMQWSVPSVGGWMYSSLKRLKFSSSHRFAVATVYHGRKFISRDIDGIRYYLLPLSGKKATDYNRHLEDLWVNIKETFKPDVIHIHGSEYPHGLAYVRACGPAGVVVSIQGIISCYARYYTSGIDYRSIQKCLIKRKGILQGQRNFEKRGILETELLGRVEHIIGRTDWDRSHTWAINPVATYYYCGETLRDTFYNNKWNYNDCVAHSIFVSQASYPIKGLHMLLQAIPLVRRKYNDTTVFVAGDDPTDRPFWKITGYGKYLKKLIKEHGLSEQVKFTGSLNEDAMYRQYLKSNLFVCCSSIENSPNSLGEAQLLGVPHLASFVGGVPEIVNWNSSVLYRFEESEMLAEKIISIFDAKGDIVAAPFDPDRYNGNLNGKLMLGIYNQIYSAQ